MIHMNRNIWWAWAINNGVYVICWTALAIIFNKWWLALFSLLFVNQLKTNGYFRICDKCGKHSEYADSPDNAKKIAMEAGWIIRKNGDEWDDLCPDCQ